MGRYTVGPNPGIDAAIEGQLGQIREVLLSELGAVRCRPQALLLSGSFGRGEGSVWYQGGELHYASDYEINVICGSPLARYALGRARRRLASTIPMPVSLSQITPQRLRDGRSRNTALGPPRRSIYMYEIKAASQVLYGSLDGFGDGGDPATLPREEGVLLLCNRVLDVIECRLRPDAAGLEPALAKLVLACGDAVLLVRGLYHYSYAERAQRIADLPPEVLRAGIGERFNSVYSEAVLRKLWPGCLADQNGGLSRQLPDIAEHTRNAFRWLGCRTAPSGEPEVILPISYTCGPLPMPPCLFEDAVTTLRAWRGRRHIAWTRLPVEARWLSIRQLLYRAIPALFLSRPEQGPPNEALLTQAWYWAGWTAGRGQQAASAAEEASGDSARSWEVLATSVCRMWHAIS